MFIVPIGGSFTRLLGRHQSVYLNCIFEHRDDEELLQREVSKLVGVVNFLPSLCHMEYDQAAVPWHSLCPTSRLNERQHLAATHVLEALSLSFCEVSFLFYVFAVSVLFCFAHMLFCF